MTAALDGVRVVDLSSGLLGPVDPMRSRRAGVAAETARPFRFYDVWDDPENRRTRAVVSYPQADWGEMQQFGVYWDLGDLPLTLEHACPAIGQHTREVLSDLGLSTDTVEALLAGGVALDRQEHTAR